MAFDCHLQAVGFPSTGIKLVRYIITLDSRSKLCSTERELVPESFSPIVLATCYAVMDSTIMGAFKPRPVTCNSGEI